MLAVVDYHRSRRSWLVLIASLVALALLIAVGYWLARPTEAISMTNTSYPIYGGELAIGNRGSHAYGDMGIAQDSNGNIYILNEFDYTTATGSHILKTDADGNYIATIGSFGRSAGRLFDPIDIVIDSEDNLWVSDSTTHTVQKFTSDGEYILSIGSPMTYGTADGQLRSPKGLALDANDNLYVAEVGNHRIQKFDKNGNFLMKIGGTAAGNTNTTFNQPSQIAISPDNEIYVADHKNQRIQKFDSNGNYLLTINQGTATFVCRNHPGFYDIHAMQFDDSGDLYVSSRQDFTLCNDTFLYKFSNDSFVGTITPDFGDLTGYGQDFIITKNNQTLYRAYSASSVHIQEVYLNNLDGSSVARLIHGDEPGDILNGPDDIVEDADGNIFALSIAAKTVTKFSSSGEPVFTTGPIANAGPTSIPTSPQKIAVDNSGVLYVGLRAGNSGGDVIYRFAPDGTPLGQLKLTGSPAQAALAYNGVGDIEFDSNNNLYIVQRPSQKLIYVFDSQTGQYSRSIGFETTVGSQTQTNITKFDIFEDKIYIAQERTTTRGSDSVRVFSLANEELRSFTLSLYDELGASFRMRSAADISLDSFGNIYLLVTNSDLPDQLVTLAPDGRFVRAIAGSFSSHPYEKIGTTTYWYSRKFSFMVSQRNNQLLLNGDHDYIKVMTVSHIAHPPSAPQNLRTTALGDGKMLIEWEAPADDGGSPITDYYIELNPDGYGQWTDVNNTDGSTYSTTINVLNGTPDVAVKAANSAGLSLPAIKEDAEALAAYGYLESHVVEDGGYLRAFAFDSEDNRYAVDQRNDRINVYDDKGAFVRSFGGDEINWLCSINLSPDSQLYVSDCGSDMIHIYELDGTFVKSIGSRGTGDGQSYYPERIIFDGDTIIILNQWYNIQRWTKDGEFIERLFTDIIEPTSLARDKDGNFYVMEIDDTAYGIHKFDADGNKLLQFGSEGEADGQFYEVYGMIVNDDNQIVINDSWNYRLQIFDSQGDWIETLGHGYSYDPDYMKFSESEGLDVDNYGNLYIGNNYSSQNTYQVLSWSGYSGGPTDPSPITNTPSAPTNLRTDVSSPNEITVAWDPPTDDGGSPITGYEVRHRPVGDSTWQTSTKGPSDRTMTIDSLTPGDYEIQIIAVNANGDSPAALLTFSVDSDGTVTPDEPTYPDEHDSGEGEDGSGLSETGVNSIIISVSALILIGSGLAILLHRARS